MSVLVGVTSERAMGKKQAPSTMTRIDADLLRRLKIVAAHRDESVVDIVNRVMGGHVEAEYRRLGLDPKPRRPRPE